MKDKIKIFISKFVQVLGVVFGVLGAVSVFLPLAGATPSNAWGRIGILIGLVVVIAIISIIWTGVEIRKTSNTIYSKGKTKFIFEYNDIEKMFENEDDEGRIFVININNDLDIVGDKVILDKAPKSVHAAFLRYLNTKSVSVSKELLSKVESKPDINIDEKGRIGDWFIVNDDALGIETKNQFLLLEVNNMSEDIKHNRVLDPLTKKDYYMCLDSLVDAINSHLGIERKIYMPLIGAGNAKVDSVKEIMFFIEGFLRFNKSELLHEIHVVIPENKRDEIPIYLLRNIK